MIEGWKGQVSGRLGPRPVCVCWGWVVMPGSPLFSVPPRGERLNSHRQPSLQAHLPPAVAQALRELSSCWQGAYHLEGAKAI